LAGPERGRARTRRTLKRGKGVQEGRGKRNVNKKGE
jgi:hypothetical protein